MGFKSTVAALRIKSWPQGSNSSLEAEIPVSWLKFQSRDSNSVSKLKLQSWDSNFSPHACSNLSLEAQIPPSKLWFHLWCYNPSLHAQIQANWRSPAFSGPLPLSIPDPNLGGGRYYFWSQITTFLMGHRTLLLAVSPQSVHPYVGLSVHLTFLVTV